MSCFPQLIEPAPVLVDRYWDLFVNQLAFSMMTDNRDTPEVNRYYRPKVSSGSDEFKTLTKDTIRRHLRGEITCMFYAANPLTQCSKWVCLDGDYEGALIDLFRLKVHFEGLGLSPLVEQSRRGAHLWLLCSEPLMSVQLRAFILSSMEHLGIPLFGGDVSSPGIEVFPRQDFLEPDRVGNGVRGPLGVHRKDFQRYWFIDSSKRLADQIAALVSARTLSASLLDSFTERLVIPAPCVANPSTSIKPIRVTAQPFSIFDHFPAPARNSADYKVICPACIEKRLVITSKGSRRGFYHCFTGCSTEKIRAALGQPLRLSRSLRSEAR